MSLLPHCILLKTIQRIRSQDGKAIAADVRFKMLVDEGHNSLLIIETVPQDAGTYECVARNSAGEAR